MVDTPATEIVVTPRNLIAAVMNYMAKRPIGEPGVQELWGALHQCRPYEAPDEPAEDTDG